MRIKHKIHWKNPKNPPKAKVPLHTYFNKYCYFIKPCLPYCPITSVARQPLDLGPPIRRPTAISEWPWRPDVSARKLTSADVRAGPRGTPRSFRESTYQYHSRTLSGPKSKPLTASVRLRHPLHSHRLRQPPCPVICTVTCHVFPRAAVSCHRVPSSHLPRHTPVPWRHPSVPWRHLTVPPRHLPRPYRHVTLPYPGPADDVIQNFAPKAKFSLFRPKSPFSRYLDYFAYIFPIVPNSQIRLHILHCAEFPEISRFSHGNFIIQVYQQVADLSEKDFIAAKSHQF